MVETASNAVLNDVLVSLSRSMLQYVGESWPWTRFDAASERETITRLVARQQEHVARLTSLLSERRWKIDFGTYPTDYTDLHFVALEYLLAQLVESGRAFAAELERTAATLKDEQAASLVTSILADEREIVSQLQQLANGPT
jgi:rubrerythrin